MSSISSMIVTYLASNPREALQRVRAIQNSSRSQGQLPSPEKNTVSRCSRFLLEESKGWSPVRFERTSKRAYFGVPGRIKRDLCLGD